MLPFAPPTIGEDEISEVVATLRSGWLSTGPRASRFEREFADFLKVPSALALNSGTAALHLALVVLGVGPGDAVILPTMTFSSAAHVIEHVGARPLFVDIDPVTLMVDLNSVERLLSAQDGNGHVRALMPVHLYGQVCDLSRIDHLASAYRVHVVEDAAHALPARTAAGMVGAARLLDPDGPNNMVAFSFYATKNVTTGEGGMLTGPAHLVARARILSLHGMTQDAHARYASDGSWHYDVVAPGFKYNLSDLQAALGIHQLARLPQHHLRRRAIASRYEAGLMAVAEVERPSAVNEESNAWHLYAIRLNLEQLTIDRGRFIEELRARRIGTSVHFIPVHMLTYYRERYGYVPEDFPVAKREFARLISLPMHAGMTDGDVDTVIDAVASVALRYRR
ncbi:MAG: DegT/DnrJ/EryC1/StrS aminotransferase family protein [Candidatus Dormibacteraeota bacterium]|uniref:DegT/DnrJ/EryC1/StrS aminotransferase family protein n=1 Tax=Candidatus Aeolococcus gillhamiae TaxID=3127015 RepID=A0A934JWN8_9BACT|nr:DegT/DnrJ/EryC1/StrS aminotransferase family protein [Candidatus Dormibacteraeota bacterium]